MSDLRVGVVGVGHLGSRHADIYRAMPGVRLEATVDLDPARGELTDYRSLFGRVDAVSIAVPTSEHHAIGLEFLKRGIPTLIEKPLAKTIAEAEALVAASAGTILQVGHGERFNPAVMAIQDVIGEPRFIECHRLGAFSFRSTDIDVVLDLMIHDIDIILHLVKAPLRRVDAVGVSMLLGEEDIANARLEFDNGAVANVTASRISDKAMRKIRVFAEDTYVSLDTMKKSAKLYRKTPELDRALEKIRGGGLGKAAAIAHVAALPKKFYEVRELRFDDAQPLEIELKAFVACVRDGTPPVVPGEHGLRAMRVAERVLAEVRGHTWK